MDSEKTLPTNFRAIISDFTIDLTTTFPEYSYLWSKWNDPEITDVELKVLFDYCANIFPQRFFDILYQNEELFLPENETDTYFLPRVSFRLLFNCEDVSENSKKTMWKYLQLMMFTVVGGIKDKTSFGDTMNMFDGIDENELHEKLGETMKGITDFFKNMENFPKKEEGDSNGEGAQKEGDVPDFEKMFEKMPGMENFTMPDMKNFPMPNLEQFQEHLKTMFNGKIGALAKEMAEEIADEFKDVLGDNPENMKSTNDVIKQLMKDPKKMMDLMKKVSGKLDSKMKSGEFSKEEMMKEANDMMSKMKEMGGQDEFNEMFRNLAKNMGGLGKNMRVDTNAMDRMSKQAATRDRLKKVWEEKQLAKAQAHYSLNATSNPNNLVFRLDGEASQEKSYIHPDILKEIAETEKKASQPTTQNKKKKGKKGKK
jgi:hypothetical protein